jgi:hypothetical protein
MQIKHLQASLKIKMKLRLCANPPVSLYFTKKGDGDLVVMDIEMFSHHEKMLKLREELLAVEEDHLAGHRGVMPNELDNYLDSIIDEMEHAKEASK